MTTLSETHVLTSREKAPEDTKSNQEQFKPDELYWIHSPVFAFKF